MAKFAGFDFVNLLVNPAAALTLRLSGIDKLRLSAFGAAATLLLGLFCGLIGSLIFPSADETLISGPTAELRALPSLEIVVTYLVLAPLTEELLFRGWVTGKLSSLLVSGVTLATVFLAGHLIDNFTEVSGEFRILWLAAFGGAVVVFLSTYDNGVRAAWYDRWFVPLLVAQSLAFALFHLTNYATVSAPIAALATVPLVFSAYVWGLIRVSCGLPYALALHSIYNVPIAMALAFA